MILVSVIILGVLGILFGIGLSIASKVFHVDVDPKIEQIEEVLPGANCGACGYPGCAAYAEALVLSGAEPTFCAPGGDEVTKKVAAILGVKASSKERRIAVIHCLSGGNNNTNFRYINKGVTTCLACIQLSGGRNECLYGCLGYNDCFNVCPFGAISLDENNMRIIDEDKCTGCGKCVEACPRNLIELVPISNKVHIQCMSQDKGKDAKAKCGNNTACIGCGLCAKKCPVDAITLENNLATINYEKCVSCGLCATVCPTKAIEDRLPTRPQPIIIDEKCIGCTICAKKCPVDAIEGKVKEVHKIDEEKCIQCGICIDVCPKKAIEAKS